MLFLSCVVVCSALAVADGVDRVYYIAAEKIEWNYAPSDSNLIDTIRDPTKFIGNGIDRIGGTYTKAIYRRYTDDNYNVSVPHEDYLGYFGPVIRAEEGDAIRIFFKNNILEANVTIHPHGLFYEKDSEGAFYLDGTTGRSKFLDVVTAGDDPAEYIWNVTSNMAPGSMDPNCIPYMYHSHLDSVSEINAGLVGGISICKHGTLDAAGNRLDVDTELIIFLHKVDENLSFFFDDNMDKCGNPSACAALAASGNRDFRRSNIMYAINGYVYGNMPRPQLCEGRKVALHVIGLGSEFDPHTLHIHGQTLVSESFSTASVAVYPAVFVASSFTPLRAGRWTMECMILSHQLNGMQAQLDVTPCPNSPPQRRRKKPRTVRQYCIAVDFVNWNYDSASPGTTYKKVRYVGYAGPADGINLEDIDSLPFTTALPIAADMGILGSTMAVEAGDELLVHFRNNADRPYSVHVEGTDHSPDLVETTPGNTNTYRFIIPDDALTDSDPDCVARLYYSDVNLLCDYNSGLIGVLRICKRGVLKRLKRSDLDKTFLLLMGTFDETYSWYAGQNDLENPSRPSRFRAINGKVANSLTGLNMCVGDDVTWHVMSMDVGSISHTAYFHGNTFMWRGRRGDTVQVAPGQVETVLMEPDNAGSWRVACDVDEYLEAGMYTLYHVEECDRPGKKWKGKGKRGESRESGEKGKRRRKGRGKKPQGIKRVYCIAIEEHVWDYAPINTTHPRTGDDLLDPATDGHIYVRDDDDFIGKEYYKAKFVDYTDSTFNDPRERTQRQVHLGLNGPMISANVGDTIEILVYNKANYSYSLHPHGVRYDKPNEGSFYDDGTVTPGRVAILPGEKKTLVWEVPPRSGPAENDPDCIVWLYSSAADPIRDPHSGLFGPIRICRPGTLDDAKMRSDVDREFVLTFAVIDENKSNYLEMNVANYAVNRVMPSPTTPWDGDFKESNQMHAINGFIYANNQGFDMVEGETVVWYVLAFGARADVHTVHWHAHSFLRDAGRRRNDVTTVYPGGHSTVEMTLNAPGKWLLHCHVNGHIHAGMETFYHVLEEGSVIPEK